MTRSPSQPEPSDSQNREPSELEAGEDLRVAALFKELTALSAEERRERLSELGRTDPELAREVESLLEADSDPCSLLDAPLRDQLAGLARAVTPSADAAPDLPDRIGDYAVLGVLGEGGMGIVLRAQQEDPRRQVALKVLKPGLFSNQVFRRFQSEGKILGRLQHPGIARLFETGFADWGSGRQPYFAMELIEGRTILEHAEHHELSLVERLELLIRVCEVVDFAHEQGVLHRDLKPSNILVGEEGPKILDFGVATSLDAGLETLTRITSSSQLIGTLAYMSPEQLDRKSKPLTRASDVYSLGVVAFQLVSGQLPYDLGGKSLPSMIRTVAEDPPRQLGEVAPSARGPLERIVARALERNRTRRYPSAAAFATDLRAHVDRGAPTRRGRLSPASPSSAACPRRPRPCPHRGRGGRRSVPLRSTSFSELGSSARRGCFGRAKPAEGGTDPRAVLPARPANRAALHRDGAREAPEGDQAPREKGRDRPGSRDASVREPVGRLPRRRRPRRGCREGPSRDV